MKLHLTAQDWNSLPFKGKIYINHWKISKNYKNHYLSLGQCIEFLTENSPDFHQNDILHGVKDNHLDYPEVVIAWDGIELIEILFWEICQLLKKRLATKDYSRLSGL
jgi:hypothetical protein